MLLTTILSQARNGEVKALSEKDKTDKVLIEYINLATVALYSRFMLITEEAIITLRDGKTFYTLGPSDADVTVNGEPMPVDRVLMVLNAIDNSGFEIPINDINATVGVFITSYDTIQIPFYSEDTVVALLYTTNPILMDGSVLCDDKGKLKDDKLTTDVKIPMAIIEPLLHYVGYRAHGTVAGSINDENNTHYMRYVASCTRIDKLGVLTMDNLQSRNVDVKGFI